MPSDVPEAMATLIDEWNWDSSALGARDSWPESLRSVLSICLGTRFPIAIYWGESLALLYNDAWRPILGAKHPQALGRPAAEVWPEIWSDIGPMFAQVVSTGEGVYNADHLLPMNRHGYVEECYFNFTFSPIRAADGSVGGIFNAVVETTEKVVGERRLETLRRLGERDSAPMTEEAAAAHVLATLTANVADIPFALLYLRDGEHSPARLVGGTMGADAARGVPQTLDPTSAADPIVTAARATQPVAIECDARFEGVRGAWPEPVRQLVVQPLGQHGQTGVLVTGVNPRRPYDDSAQTFLGLVARQCAATLTSARALAAERRRAESLAELDRAKTTFFSNISHEFRTPLTLMLGPLENALGSPARALSGADLDVAHRNALRLLKLVNALLDFARIEAGGMRATYAEIDLSAFTTDLAASFRSAIERAGLAFEVDCSPSIHAFVDQAMWEKIVLNLLSNALKFTFSGSIAITLREARSHVELTVRDTGTGIAEAELPHLFKRFHRVENARARNHEGSGIGLALVHELVRLHGGKVSVESQLDQGTTFVVSLPGGHAHLPAEHVQDAPTDAPRVDTATHVLEAERWSTGLTTTDAPVEGMRNARVLLADDNADMREYVTRILAPHYSVEAVVDGAAALAAASARTPDLVLTDVMMPNLDGFGLLRALRARDETSRVPVIILSARAGDEARVEGLEAGADDYLTKPFAARELVARVAVHLQIARYRNEAERERGRLHDLFMQAPIPIAITRGPDHVFALVNALYQRLHGDYQLLGVPLREAIPQAAGSPFIALRDRVYTTGERTVVSETMVPKGLLRDGTDTDRFFTFMHEPMRDSAGAVEGIMTIAFEVTEQVIARERIEAAVRTRDDFLSVASHELRTPITSLALQTELTQRLLSKGADVAQLSEKLAAIRKQAGRLELLVDGLLDVSRITAGRLELNPQPTDLAAVIREVTERLAEQAAAAGSAIELELQSVVGLWDPLRLEQIVVNLVSNAIKYGAGRPIAIQTTSSAGRARLTVRDQGIGMKPEDLARLFGRFERFVESKNYAGLGLGLWIVREILRVMQGEVHVESVPDQGTTFVVELPLTTAGD